MFGLIASLTAIFATAELSVPISVVSIETIETRAQAYKRKRRERMVWAPQCRKVYAMRKKLAAALVPPKYYPEKLIQLADRIENGWDGCHKRPEFATDLRDHAAGAGPVPMMSDDQTETLINRLSARPDSASRILALRRGLWLRRGYYDEPPLGFTPETKRAYLASDAVWHWLNENSKNNQAVTAIVLEVFFDPASPRYDPARAIEMVLDPKLNIRLAEQATKAAELLAEGKAVPKDEARAEAELWKLVDYHDPARVALVKILAPRLTSKDLIAREQAISSLTRLAHAVSYYGVSSGKDLARQTLLSIHLEALQSKDMSMQNKALEELVLLAGPTPEGTLQPIFVALEERLKSSDLAIRNKSLWQLAYLSRKPIPQASAMLEAQIKTIKNVMVINNPDSIIANTRSFLTPDDYPASAVRNEETGTVSAKVLVGTDGRVIQTYITGSASATLDAVVERSAMRRIRVRDPKYLGKYLMLTLPDIQFDLGECQTDVKPPSAKPGALQIISNYCPQRVVETPIPVSVVGN